MANQPKFTICLVILFTLSLLPGACLPKSPSPGPDINNLVATGMLGTRQAWAIGTIVSATNAALASQAATLSPPAASTPSPTLLPTIEHPCSSRGGGKLSYADTGDGYCLFYPDDFFVNKPGSGTVEFFGPALDQSAEPLRAYISIARKEPVKDRTLDEIAMSVWKEAHGYQMMNIQLGGQDALVAEGLKIRNIGWNIQQVLFVHHGSVYLITLSPVDSKEPYSKARPDVDRFWEMARGSFVFR